MASERATEKLVRSPIVSRNGEDYTVLNYSNTATVIVFSRTCFCQCRSALAFVFRMSSPHDEHWLAGPYSTQFHCRTYTASNPKAILVFLHGFIEHVGRYEHVFPVWQQRNISVFTFDQRGFGRTAEDKEKRSKDSSYAKTSDKHQMEDTEWAVKTAKKMLGEDLPTFLMGHSMVRIRVLQT